MGWAMTERLPSLLARHDLTMALEWRGKVQDHPYLGGQFKMIGNGSIYHVR